jgi:small ubiquitin-related modifier
VGKRWAACSEREAFIYDLTEELQAGGDSAFVFVENLKGLQSNYDALPKEQPSLSSLSRGEEQKNKRMPEESKSLHVKIVGQDGTEWVFKVKDTTAMEKVFGEYVKRKHERGAGNKLRFCFNGRTILPEDTPSLLEMQDNDTIEVFASQTGG